MMMTTTMTMTMTQVFAFVLKGIELFEKNTSSNEF
jgi:hypothetical protein